ncbi:MAG: hypothetical protein ACR2J8_15430, partial [Thermomicrobiales bacterium]
MRRLIAIVAVFAVLSGWVPADPAVARQEDYSPDAVAAALLATAIPTGDAFWTGPVQETKADTSIGQVHVIEAGTVDGMVVFEIYQDASTATGNLATDGEMYAIDDAAITGYDDPASPAAAARAAQGGVLLGTSLWTLDTGNGAASCGQLRNVLVCGITPSSGSTAPDSIAVMSAVNGLAMLATLAPPPSAGDVAPPADAAQPVDAPADGSGKGKKGKKGEQPADQPPAEQPPVEQPPVVQTPVEAPPVEAPAPAASGITGAVIPRMAAPGGLNAPGPVAYELQFAGPIVLDAIGNGTVQAAAGYTADEVRFILAHPGWMSGKPYAAVMEELTRRGSSLVTR